MTPEAPKSLLEENRIPLRAVFAKLSPNKEGRIQYSETLKFFKGVHVVPDLVALVELKKLIETVTGLGFTTRSMLNFFQFEQLIREMAVAAFSAAIPVKDKEKMLVLHIKAPMQSNYAIFLEEPKESRSITPAFCEKRPRTDGQSDTSSLKIDLDISAALSALKSPTHRANSSGRNTPTYLSPKTIGSISDRLPTAPAKLKVSRLHRKSALTIEVPNKPLESPRKSLVTLRRPPSLSIRAKSQDTNSILTAAKPTSVKPFERPSIKKVEFKVSPKSVVKQPEEPKPVVKQPEGPKPVAKQPEGLEGSLYRCAVSLNKHRAFIIKKASRSFTQEFALRAILRAWSDCIGKKHTLS